MNPKPFTAFIIVGAGTGINATRQIQKGNQPFVTVLGGIVFGTICVAVNDVTSSDLGTMLAMIYLLTSVLTNGVSFMNTLTNVVENY